MPRSVYDSRFRSKMTVEAIRNKKTVAQIASEQEELKHVQAASLTELRKAVNRYFVCYNGGRTHSALGYRLSQRRLQGGPGQRRLNAVLSTPSRCPLYSYQGLNRSTKLAQCASLPCRGLPDVVTVHRS